MSEDRIADAIVSFLRRVGDPEEDVYGKTKVRVIQILSGF
jgi:hypothetical protein